MPTANIKHTGTLCVLSRKRGGKASGRESKRRLQSPSLCCLLCLPVTCNWASLIAQLVKNLPAEQETWVQSLGWEDPWRRERLPSPVFWPGEFHGLYSPWGCKESDSTE